MTPRGVRAKTRGETPTARNSRYRFVEFAAAAQPGFRNCVVPEDSVPALVERYGATECYASIFRFSDEALLYLAEHRAGGRASLAGFDGRVWAPFLPIDIDGEAGDAGLTEALELARAAYGLLIDDWSVPAAAVHCFFSGAKGFHILVDVRAAGRLAPSRDLQRVFSRLRLEIFRQLPARPGCRFDLAIGDKLRLLRLPNTRHAASGLFKVELEAGELARLGAGEIRALAAAPRPLTRLTADGLEPVDAVETSATLYARFEHARGVVRRQRGPHPYRLGPPPEFPEAALCAARLDIWTRAVAAGNRNNAAIRLASAFRLAGYDEAAVRDLLLQWNRDRRIGLPEREVLAVVRSAFARWFPYTYGCHDQVVREHCPYVGRLRECVDYRAQGARSGGAI